MAKKIRGHFTLIVQTLGMGGAEVFLTDLLSEWQRRGVKLTAWITYAPFRRYLTSPGLPTHRLPTVSDIVGNWKGLLKAIIFFPYALSWYGWVLWRQRRTQAVILSGFVEKILVGVLSRFIPIPIVWFEFGPMETLLQKFGGLPRWLYRLVVSTPLIVIVPSEHTRQHLLADGLIPPNKLVVIPCGRSVPVSTHFVASPQPTVVCVSRLEQGKGQDVLVRAWPQVIKAIPTAQLLIVGEGDFEVVIKQEVTRLGLATSVTLLGRVPDALALLASATVCVFPSVWALEGFGMVTIEAMALGKPIVAFATGPTPELIQHNVTGLLAKVGDEAELAQQIVALLKSQKLRQRLGAQAQQAFRARYTIERCAEVYYQAMIKALETK